MPDIAKFQLGPVVIQIRGNHPVVTWAKDAFAMLRSDGDPAILFGFTETASAQSPDGIAYRLPRFELAIERANDNALKVEIFQRDQRSLLSRSLCSPAKSWRTWLAQGGSLDLSMIKDFAYKTSPFLMQIAMLNAGCSLAHAASFAVDDQALLLVAGSGVGKTSVLLQTILNGNARFLSDDHAIVDQEGSVHLHPMPMHIYGQSLKNNPQLTRFDSWQWRTRQKLDARHAVRWIPPADIFGTEKLAHKATLREVVVIVHGDESQLSHRIIESDEAVELCTAFTIDELHEFNERLDAGRGKILPTAAIAGKLTRQVFESAFTGRNCSVVTVPPKTGADSIVQFLRKHSPLVASAFTT